MRLLNRVNEQSNRLRLVHVQGRKPRPENSHDACVTFGTPGAVAFRVLVGRLTNDV